MLRRLFSSSPDSRGGIPGLDPHPPPPDPRPRVRPGWGGAHSPDLAPSPEKTQTQPSLAGMNPRPRHAAAQGPSVSTPSSPEHLEPAPCHLPCLSLGLPGSLGLLTAPFTRFPPELHTAPFKLGPPSLKSPFLHSGNLSSLGNPALYAEVPWSLEHAPSPLPGGPYLLPRVPLPSHIPVRRSGGPETVESSVRGLDTPHSSCSGSRAGLGSPRQARPLAPPPPQPPLPPPPRSLQQLPLRAPGQLPVRRRDRQAQGADGNESNGALRRQQRPMERGGGTGDRRQRPLAVTRRHAARREGSGGGAAAPRGQVLGAETTDVKETLPTLEDVTFSNLSAATEHYLRDLGSTCLHFLIYSSRLNSVNPLLPLTTPLKTLFVSKFKG
ncbi:vegetative cell wall protein gp1-like [Sus scrofa]|uniref:vegetative cell wall protein gp1-like n=1 Tax=Sus scrofa TaxID=9823 RepID=UPI000A2B0BFC|nr:vegetative cell wall protein gp1-like [Sus scrofa]